VPLPYFYAADDSLAAWILAFNKVGASVRKEIVRKAGFLEEI